MHVVIFAGGTFQPGKAIDEALRQADLIIGADSGAATALDYGYKPDFAVGDFDSLNISVLQKLQEEETRIIHHAIEKDETDTELAVRIALEQGATQITILGALGGVRFDHAIANILLLADIETVLTRILDGETACWLVRGPNSSTIYGQEGDLLSLFPLTVDTTGIYTEGLYYSLRGETLRFGKPRGISNKLTQKQARVSLEMGMLLIIHTGNQKSDQ